MNKDSVQGIFGFKETRKDTLVRPERQSIEQTEDYAVKQSIQTKELISEVSKFGNVGDGNYIDIDNKGNLTLIGEATVWKKNVSNGYGWRLDDGFEPTWHSSGLASSVVGYYRFRVGDAIHLVLETPTDYQMSSTLKVFINFCNIEEYNPLEPTLVSFEVEICIAQKGTPINITNIEVNTEMALSLAPWTDLYTTLYDIEGLRTTDSKLIMKIKRGRGDTFTSDIAIFSVGYFYESDKLGQHTQPRD